MDNMNCLNIKITRPTQELIIMRGIPGSGKSTEAKKRVKNGVIHSTDDLWEATGDYAGAFKRMKESGDWSDHSRMHTKNFKNAMTSIKEGVSPIIIDNTNIKAVEAKKYVETALKLGFNESNITIVDVGNGGCTVEVLAERNTHGVPLETIERMMKSHKSVGPLSVKKILEAKSMNSTPKFAYVKLDDKSRVKLMTSLSHHIPKGWLLHGHHMTVSFGKDIPKELKGDVGKTVELRVISVGTSDMAIAVGVEGFPSTNKIPHITLGVNPDGKPVMSKDITVWKTLDSHINLNGEVMETTPFVSPTTVKP